jgi:predicted metal-dependent hydrolase
MSHKSAKIELLIAKHRGVGLDAHYLGYFECFNTQLFYEAHDVLEELWLGERHGRNGNFYKGLIQLAGAFVHLQKRRAGPALALFRLAENNLRPYPAVHESLETGKVLGLIESWRARIEKEETVITRENAPMLRLEEGLPSREALGPETGT